MLLSNKQSLVEQIESAQLSFKVVAADPQIQQRLADYGCGPERLAQGQALLERLVLLSDTQRAEYGEKFDNSRELDDARRAADATYDRLRKLARIAFKEDGPQLAALGLAADRRYPNQGFEEWLGQLGAFYRVALAAPAILERLAAVVKVERAELEAAQAQYLTVYEASARQRNSQVDAKQATQRRNEAQAELRQWLVGFADTARAAFMDEPQKLKALGL